MPTSNPQVATNDKINPLPSRDLLAYAMKTSAEDTYLRHHPNPNRSARRAMKRKLLPVYMLIGTLTSEENWRNTLYDNADEQMRAANLTAAFAQDIALGNNPLDPNSSSQIVRRWYMED